MLLLIILYSFLFCQKYVSYYNTDQYHYKNIEYLKIYFDTVESHLRKTETLVDISWDYINYDLDSAIYYNDLALKYSSNYSNQILNLDEEFNVDLHAKVLSVRGEIFKFRADYDSALYYENKAIEIRDSVDLYGFKYSYIVKGDVYLEKGNFLLAQLNYKKAFGSVMQAMRYYNLPAYTFESEEFYNILYYFFEDKLIALKEERYTTDDIEKAIIKYKHLNKIKVFRALFNYFEVILKMGIVETQLGNYTKALDYFSRIKPFLELEKEKYYSLDYFVIENLYYLGHTYRKLNQIDSSMKYLNLAVYSSSMRPYYPFLAKSYREYAKLYQDLNKADSFNVYINKSSEILKKIDLKYEYCENELDKISYLLRSDKKELSVTKNKLDSIKNYIESNGLLNLQLRLYDSYFKYYKLVNNNGRALHYLEKKSQINDSIFKIDFNNKIAENRELLNISKIELKLQESDVKIKESKLENAFYKNIMIILTIGIIFGVLVLIFIYLNKRKVDKLNNELSQKNQTIVEITKNKEELLSILAHDIKSPIILSSKAITLIKDKAIENKDEYISLIEDAMIRIQTLITNILTWVSSESGEIKTEIEELNIFDLISEILIKNEYKLKEKNIELVLNIEKEKIKTDKNTLEIILNNLINNAIKFSEINSKIYINYINKNFEIINYGIPFDKEQLIELETNNRTYSKLGTKDEKGTGLGLKIIINLCKLNNIEFKVESNGNQSKIKLTFK